jgi:hypothetical protein
LGDKQLYEQKAKSWARQCEDVITSWPGYQNFILSKFELDWSPRRRCSRGGWYKEGAGISIAMSVACMPRTSPYRMYEYKSFDADSLIGGFYATDENLSLGLHVCHEMAHAAQFYSHFNLGIISDRPHGNLFKDTYRKLRVAVLNRHIPVNQKQLKEQYEEMLLSFVRGGKLR